MRKSTLLVLASFFLGGLLVSCSVNRGFISTITHNDIQQIQQFEPFCYFGLIENGNKVTYNDSLTSIAKGLFETALANDKILPVTETIIIDDSIVNKKVRYEISLLTHYIMRNVRVKDIPIPPTIDSILQARNERFGLLSYNCGFTRTGSNYAGQIGKGALIGILTLGSFYTVPYKEMVRNGIIIVDSKNHNIAFVSTSDRESDPMNAETYRKQIVDLMKKYKK